MCSYIRCLSTSTEKRGEFAGKITPCQVVSMKLRETAQGTLIDIHVKPQSKQFQIAVEEDELLVFCRESPVKGRVNRELIKELSRLFKRRVQILSGFRSRQKRLLIENAGTQEVSEILSHAHTRGNMTSVSS